MLWALSPGCGIRTKLIVANRGRSCPPTFDSLPKRERAVPAGPGRHRRRERAAEAGEQNSAQGGGSADQVEAASTRRHQRVHI